MSELAKLLVIEAALRSANQATQEGCQSVQLDHVETILPQLVIMKTIEAKLSKLTIYMCKSRSSMLFIYLNDKKENIFHGHSLFSRHL